MDLQRILKLTNITSAKVAGWLMTLITAPVLRGTRVNRR